MLRLQGSKCYVPESCRAQVTEEPDEGIVHVRFCGGGPAGNRRPYPTRERSIRARV